LILLIRIVGLTESAGNPHAWDESPIAFPHFLNAAPACSRESRNILWGMGKIPRPGRGDAPKDNPALLVLHPPRQRPTGRRAFRKNCKAVRSGGPAASSASS